MLVVLVFSYLFDNRELVASIQVNGCNKEIADTCGSLIRGGEQREHWGGCVN